MDPTRLGILQILRPRIRARWSALLRAERTHTALANPAILERMFDTTLDEVFRSLESAAPTRSPLSSTALREGCGCGRNHLMAYFLTCERALVEALLLIEGREPQSAAGELGLTIRRLARREIASFCSLCQLPAAGGERACGGNGRTEDELAVCPAR